MKTSKKTQTNGVGSLQAMSPEQLRAECEALISQMQHNLQENREKIISSGQLERLKFVNRMLNFLDADSVKFNAISMHHVGAELGEKQAILESISEQLEDFSEEELEFINRSMDQMSSHKFLVILAMHNKLPTEDLQYLMFNLAKMAAQENKSDLNIDDAVINTAHNLSFWAREIAKSDRGEPTEITDMISNGDGDDLLEPGYWVGDNLFLDEDE